MTQLLIHPYTQQQLEQVIHQSPHAIGLFGEAGAGKAQLARHLAAQLLDSAPEQLASHPYVLQLDCARKTGIEEVRDMQRFLSLTVPGHQAKRRCVILEDVHYLSTEAQNALLKTLEEPPADTILIATFSDSRAVLATIQSRLQVERVLAIDFEQVLQTYGSTHSPEKLQRLYYMSGGLAGLLTALLEDSHEHPLVVAVNQARQLLSSTRFERIIAVDSLTKQKDIPVYDVVDGLYRLLEASYHQAVRSSQIVKTKTIATRLSLVDEALRDLRHNVNPKLVLDRLFMSI